MQRNKSESQSTTQEAAMHHPTTAAEGMRNDNFSRTRAPFFILLLAVIVATLVAPADASMAEAEQSAFCEVSRTWKCTACLSGCKMCGATCDGDGHIGSLNLANKNLTALPMSIGNLAFLTDLSLANNNLVELPNSIALLTKLLNLDLRGNQLRNLPISMVGMAKSTAINTEGNFLDCDQVDPLINCNASAQMNCTRILEVEECSKNRACSASTKCSWAETSFSLPYAALFNASVHLEFQNTDLAGGVKYLPDEISRALEIEKWQVSAEIVGFTTARATVTSHSQESAAALTRKLVSIVNDRLCSDV